VRAGEQTEVCVRNAFLNLEPAEASALRRRTRRIVIEKERTAAIRATPWTRPLWSAGGAPGKVGLFVLSASPLSRLEKDDSPVDWSEWCPVPELADAFTWVYRDRSTDPSRFEGLEAAARMAQQHTSMGPSQSVVDRLERAQHGALIQCEVADPADLGYLQVGWAIARWLLQRGDGIVLDGESGHWWTSEQLISWEAGGWPGGRRFVLEREVCFHTSVEANLFVVETRGLSKFGRPELVCEVVSEDSKPGGAFAPVTIPGWVMETMERVAMQLAMGSPVRAGDVLTCGSMQLDVEPESKGKALVLRRRA
jgi:hypothetical protein